jgi:chemotaxis protein CheD
MNIVVGVSDMKVHNDPKAILITYSLGSCIGIAIHDPVARVGGILHFMLPESSLDPDKAQTNPFMFCDTGLPTLFKTAYAMGAKKRRIKVVVVGGAQVLDQQGFFNIGKRNYMAIRRMLWKNNMMIDYEDVGGMVNRTLKMAVGDGRVWLKISGKGEVEI